MKKKAVVGGLLFLLILLLVAAAVKNRGSGSERAGDLAFSGTSGNVAVVYIEGTIVGGRGGGSVFGETVTAADDVLEELQRIGKDPAIKGVLLRINSPGGSAPASQEIGEEIDKLKKKGIKVVASMGDVAASGGYWIAAKADKIVANPATLTGSIGVIMETHNLEELYRKLGIKREVIKSGPYKDIGSDSRPMTEEERQLLQGMVDDIYNQFVEVVAEGRRMPREKVKALADGRIFTGRQALKLGLVDELGNYFDALEVLKKEAGLKEVSVKTYRRRTFLDFLWSGEMERKELLRLLTPNRYSLSLPE
ncbi:MAG: protease [Eubacteriales bacterium]|nr:protease [Eubacteriales bacterium]MDN5363073.1 protease [Eubacteriales bacterium]